MRRPGFGRLAIAIALVAVALGVLVFLGTRSNLTYYYEIDELKATAARAEGRIRVSGDVVQGSIVKDEATRQVRFAIQGATRGGPDPARQMPVVYTGILPDIFRPGIQVVVEGRLDEKGTFQAETLLAKCPSKYQAAGELDSPTPPPRS